MTNQDSLADLKVAKEITEEQINKLLITGSNVKQLEQWQNRLSFIKDKMLHIVLNQIPPYAY